MDFQIYVTYQEEGKHYKNVISDNFGLWMLVSEFGIGTLTVNHRSLGFPNNGIGNSPDEIIMDEMHIDNNPKMKTRYIALGIIDDKDNFLTKPIRVGVRLKKSEIPLIEDIIRTKKNYKEMKQLCSNMNHLNTYDKFYKSYEYDADSFYSMLEMVVNHLKKIDGDFELFNCEERRCSEKNIENIFKYCDNKPVKK